MAVITIGTEVTFEAGHYLPYYDGACRNQHGHSYRLQVDVVDDKGRPTLKDKAERYTYMSPRQSDYKAETGMVMDLKILRAEIKEVVDKLDHINLNFIIPNPTAENIILWIYYNLAGVLSERYGVRIHHMKLWETANNYVEYWG